MKPDHPVVSREEWLEARKQHLEKEKEFTRLRDQLSAERRELPWVRVDKVYFYKKTGFPGSEGPGISVFYRDGNGNVYHTYSCYARCLDMLNGAYHFMDLAPKGRDEDELPYTMAWVRRRDQYETE